MKRRWMVQGITSVAGIFLTFSLLLTYQSPQAISADAPKVLTVGISAWPGFVGYRYKVRL